MEKRKNFYKDELNLERMEEMLKIVIETLTLKEILKMIREISYDMVCYYNDKDCGIIYRDTDYDKEQQLQACKLQRLLSASCDLFGQSIINKNKFNDGYLNKWLNGGLMELEIVNLKHENEVLKEQIDDLKQQIKMERNDNNGGNYENN